jgi:hypothetical protein
VRKPKALAKQEGFELSADPGERRKQVRELIKCAEKGDESILPAIRELLDLDPSLVEGVGNLALQVQASWIKAYTGGNLVLVEAAERKMREMRDELAGPSPSPLERLLVERILACWVQMNYLDAIYAQRMASGEAVAWEAHEGHQRRQDRAHGRFLSAVKTLALVRRLGLPALQVNIGDKQVNVV